MIRMVGTMLVAAASCVGCAPSPWWQASTPGERAAQAKARRLYAQPEQPPAPAPDWFFTFSITLPAGETPMVLRSHHSRLDASSAARLEAAFTRRHQFLLECFGPATRWAQFELQIAQDASRRRTRDGVDKPQAACLQAEVERLLLEAGHPTGGRVGVRLEHPEVRGSLSKEGIRQTVRKHIDEVRFCYVEGLRERFHLRGHVSIKFIILPNGQVSRAAVARTTLGHPRVERCIARVLSTWRFKRPAGGGIVVVTYPFVLR